MDTLLYESVALDTSEVLPNWDEFLRNWSFSSFEEAIRLAKLSAIVERSLFSKYAWEIFDKVFDYSLSDSFYSSEVLMMTVKLIAANCRPRELYMMVVEKIASSGYMTDLSCLPVLLFSMQLSLLELSSSVFIRDGLSIILKALIISSSIKDATTASHVSGSRRLEIVSLALSFCEGVASRGNFWLNKVVTSSSVELPFDRAYTKTNRDSSYKDHAVVSFLLGLCSGCVLHLDNASQRAACVQHAVYIIDRHTAISYDSMFKLPYRARNFILASQKRSCEWGHIKASPTYGNCGIDTCIYIPEGYRDLVERYLESTAVSEGGLMEENAASVAVEQMVSWNLVTDEGLLGAVSSGTDGLLDDQDDVDNTLCAAAVRRRHTARCRTLASVKRRRRNCGLDVAGLDTVDVDTSEHDSMWSLLGVAMVAECILSASSSATVPDVSSERARSPSTAANTVPYSLARVLSAEYLWHIFYPLLLPLLRAAALASVEGLRFAGHLDPIMKAVHAQRSGASFRAPLPLIFLPRTLLSVMSQAPHEGDRGKRNTSGISGRAEAACSDILDCPPLQCVLRVLSAMPSSGSVDIGMVRVLRAAVGAARSADSLTLAQAMLNAMVSCSDSQLRSMGLRSFKDFLLLFEPVSLMCLLKLLVKDCPFPRVVGLLLDIVKDRSQACSHLHCPVLSPALPDNQAAWPPSTCNPLSEVGRGVDGGGRERERDADPLVWDSLGSSLFFSALTLRTFCIPSIEKIKTVTAQQILDSADEFGAAINLLQHFAIRVNGVFAAFKEDSLALSRCLHSFLGRDMRLLASGSSYRTEGDPGGGDVAVEATRQLFNVELRSLVEVTTDGVKGKVQKLLSKLTAAGGGKGFQARSPWTLRVEKVEEQECVDTATPFDLLQLEVILDNLEFLLRTL